MYNYRDELSLIGWLVYACIYVIIPLIVSGWLLSCFVITKQKTAKIVETLGKFSGVRRAGLSFKLPYPIGVVAATVPLNIVKAADEVGVKSSDNAFLGVPWNVHFRVIEDKIKEAHYELDNPVGQMKSYITNSIRGKANDMTMNDLFKSKDAFEKEVSGTLGETFSKYGYEIVSVLVDDPQPSEALREAFDKVLGSERDKEAASNRAEAKRIEMVGEAKAEGESLVIKAKSFKAFRSEIAEGNADAISKFLKGTEGLVAKDVLEFFEGVDTRDAIRDAAKHEGTVVVIPTNQSGSQSGELISMIKALQDK